MSTEELAQINKTLTDLYVVTRESALNHICGEIFVVNSGSREGGHANNSDSDFFFKFPALFNSNATRIVILQASVPKTFYLVGTNFITVTEGAKTFTFSLPKGNYNVISFRGTLTKLMTLMSGNYGMGYIYSVDALNRLRDVETGLMTLRVQGNAGVQPSITLDSSSIHERFGLHPNTTYQFSDNKLTSVHVCNFNLHSQVFIRSDICQNTQDNILQDIYAVSNISNSYIAYENKAPALYSKRLNHNEQVYHFWLTDARGAIIDLNGIEMSFTVLVY